MIKILTSMDKVVGLQFFDNFFETIYPKNRPRHFVFLVQTFHWFLELFPIGCGASLCEKHTHFHFILFLELIKEAFVDSVETTGKISIWEYFLKIGSIHRFESPIFFESIISFTIVFHFVMTLCFPDDKFDHFFFWLFKRTYLGIEVTDNHREQRITFLYFIQNLLILFWGNLMCFQHIFKSFLFCFEILLCVILETLKMVLIKFELVFRFGW